jgi:large subunit ribosomal protein L31
MKKDAHPDYHTITVVLTDGSSYETGSTMGKPGDILRLDVDPRTHPAWTGGAQRLTEAGQLARFNKRFSGFGLGPDMKKEEAGAQEKKA